MIEKATNDQIRAMLAEWLARNNWTNGEIHRGMRDFQVTDIASVSLIEKFLKSDHPISRPYALGLLRFIETYPEIEPFDDFQARLKAKAIDRSTTRESEVVARLEANERRRAEYVQRQLADEHKPKPRARSILFGLEKDVVAALSGAQL